MVNVENPNPTENITLPTLDELATVIYNQNPSKQPWNGDNFGYNEIHWAAEHNQKLARKQAQAVIDLLTTK
jgi:hypothetical protein